MSSLEVSTSMTAAFGSVVNNDCSNQALVLDVSPALGSGTPNRTAWAQAALMWSMVLSQSQSDVSTLRNFVRDADWSSIENVDGPTYVGYAGSDPGTLVQRNNVFVGSGTPESSGSVASLGYSYSMDSASNVKSIVTAGAGTGRIST